jgi:nucleotide-binding universal stress UspA family protein
MSFYNKILVGIDGSEESIHAAEQAMNLLGGQGEMTLLSVVSRDFLEYHGESPERLDEESATYKAMADVVTGVEDKARAEGVAVDLVVDTGGKIFQKIVDNAQFKGAEAVVLGASRDPKFKRRLLGGTSTKVIGYADCDVMMVPRSAEVDLKNIVAATDGSIHGHIAVRRAVDLAREAKGKLDIISVVEETAGFPANVTFPGGRPIADISESSSDVPHPSFEEYLNKKVKAAKEAVEEERDRARHEGVKAEVVVPTGKPWKVLVKETEGLKPGLIVMGSHGRTGLKRLLMGSVTQRVIEHACCPVLVVR